MPFEYAVYCCSVPSLVSIILLHRKGFSLNCMLIILSVFLGIQVFYGLLLGSRTGYVRLVGQEPAPSQCVLLSTSREVRRDMKDWVLSDSGDQWSVKFAVRDLSGHLDTTFRWVVIYFGCSGSFAYLEACFDVYSPS